MDRGPEAPWWTKTPQTPEQGALLRMHQQLVAGAVGQQLTELGIEVARRNLRVQPTIEVRNGYRLNVMVNQDIGFPGTCADH